MSESILPGPATPEPARTSPLVEGYDRRLSTFLWILVGFLVADAILRLSFLGAELFAADREDWRLTRPQFWNLILAVFYLVLVLELLVRSFVARVSLTIVFLVQIGMIVARYAINSPEDWWGANVVTRIQLNGQLLFFFLAVVLINRSPARELLRR